MIFLFLLFIIVPIAVYKWAKKYRPQRVWTFTLFSFGLIVCQLAYGLHGLGIIPYIGLPFLAISGFIYFFHSSVGYKLALALGIQEPGVVVSGLGSLWTGIINGLLWGVLYGLLGFLIDLSKNLSGQAASRGAIRVPPS